MSNPLVLWSIAALVLFWSVGAYNRLVRLRSNANDAFAAMAGELLDEVTQLWSGLRAAATQVTASVAAMRPRPLRPEAAAVLSEARDVLLTAWVRVAQEANDLAGSSIPEALTQQWQQLSAQARAAAENFNQAVDRYNAAIAQFPALLLAELFGFKAARRV
jgi:LemA protein